MNKYQEALDDIKYNTRYRYVTFKRSSLETLQELVDKETPKKVFKESLQDALCVKCGSYINFDMLNNKIEHAPKYCAYCGQKLDWSECENE